MCNPFLGYEIQNRSSQLYNNRENWEPWQLQQNTTRPLKTIEILLFEIETTQGKGKSQVKRYISFLRHHRDTAISPTVESTWLKASSRPRLCDYAILLL